MGHMPEQERNADVIPKIREVLFRSTEGKEAHVRSVTQEGGDGRTELLLSLVVYSEGHSIDVLEDLGLKGAVHIELTEDSVSSFNRERNRIRTTHITHPFDLATLLHELGHRKQVQEPETFREDINYADSHSPFGDPLFAWSFTVPEHPGVLQEGMDMFPGEAIAQNPDVREYKDTLEQLERTRNALYGVSQRLGESEKYQRGQTFLGRLWRSKRREIDRLQEEDRKLRLEEDAIRARLFTLFHGGPPDAEGKAAASHPGSAVRDVMMHPIRRLENDTNSRVRLWLQAWRERGVDLTGSYDPPAGKKGAAMTMIEDLQRRHERSYGMPKI